MALSDLTLKKDKVADVYCTDQGTLTYTIRLFNDSTDALQLEYLRDEFQEGNEDKNESPVNQPGINTLPL